MCYSVKALLKTQLNRAIKSNDAKAIAEIQEKLLPFVDHPFFHVSGFSFPALVIYTSESGHSPIVSHWGLVPHWVKDVNQMKQIRSNTLNARMETVFSKASFRDSIRERRCVIQVDGFYEYHHFMRKKYPFFLYSPSKDPLTLAGIWNDWVDINSGEIYSSFSILTTNAKGLLAKIHNNPKLNSPRSPLILSDEGVSNWLDTASVNTESQLTDFVETYYLEDIIGHSVGALSGKRSLGNTKVASEELEYPELAFAFDE